MDTITAVGTVVVWVCVARFTWEQALQLRIAWRKHVARYPLPPFPRAQTPSADVDAVHTRHGRPFWGADHDNRQS